MKTDLFSEILEITRQQKLALKNENIEEFEKFVAMKQIHMDAIDTITKKGSNPLNDTDKKILEEIIELDKENQEEFNRQLKEVKIQLQKIRALKKRDNVYSNPYDISYEEGVFFDKK